MISLFFSRSPLCTAAIVFYTCVCIPFLQLKRAFFSFFLETDADEIGCRGSTVAAAALPPCISVSMFQDLGCDGGEEICPICLADFDGEDAVSRLPRCGHVFHANCIETWLLRDRFTCPLCRALVFVSDASSGPSDCCVLMPALNHVRVLAVSASCVALCFFFRAAIV